MKIQVFLLIGLIGLVWIVADTIQERDGSWEMASAYRVAAGEEEYSYHFVRQERPPVYLHPDTYYWMMLARDDRFHPRSHRVLPIDNAPHGRPFYWSSIYRDYLRAITSLQIRLGYEPEMAWKQTAVWSGPLLFMGLVCLLFLFSVRHARIPETIVLCGGLLLPAFRREFLATTVDYHGLQHAAILGMVLLFVCGGACYAVSSDVRRYPLERFFVIASGVLGGLAVALQSTLVAPLIGGVLAAGALVAFLFISPGARQGIQPDRWRDWGWAGGLASLALYVVEFGFSPPVMRLEVNHPLFALFWIGGAEMVRQMWQAEAAGEWKERRRWIRLSGWGALALGYPAAVAFGPVDWFILRDPFMVRLHETILEFEPLRATFEQVGWHVFPLLFGALPLILLLALSLIFVRQTQPDEKMVLLAATLPALIAGRMTLEHVRFAGLLTALMLLVAWVFIRVCRRIGSTSPLPRWDIYLAIVLLLSFLPAFFLSSRVDAQRRHYAVPDGTWLVRMQMRDLALDFAEYVGPDSVKVLTDGNMSPILQYYTPHHGVGGLYWENREGLLAVAAVLSDYGEEKARSIIVERGLGYLLFDASLDQLARIHYAYYGWVNEAGLQRMLAFRIAHEKDLPDWLVPAHPEEWPLAWVGSYRLFQIQIELPIHANQDEGIDLR